MKRLRGKLGTPRKTSATLPAKPPSHTHLSAEERALWGYVAGGVAPIKVKSRVPRRGAVEEAQADSSVPSLPPRKVSSDPLARKASSVQHADGVTTPTAKSSPLADFDARKAKKLGKGRTAIDARLDLHGLRQDEAHLRLRRFLRDCHHDGLKHVLVITGKGRETDDPAISFADTLDRQPRGVLRRNVPRWLAEPDLRPLIVSYTTATPRHGGDGAFYIELRRIK